ncbi:hypothetical protein [Micromonospora endolithica]|uniref:Uncharacterized protein n=1 Tax=Micromonospora endolithica TaxID=230091 RepID=A0A3A9YRN4_9ACTN|nr:hypothetical protein [Micromonospora endolithica]RKN38678.1 hypothetical protein D7223_30630 [Micromonospora endolithica]TWJ25294.1 hypothetical protein JD76_05457 [Micromonospora endolithica]
MNTKQGRAGLRAAALLATLPIGVAAQLVATTPAAAVSGLIRTTHVSTATDSQSPKTRAAECPSGMRVIGGGARVSGPAAGSIRLSHLQPISGPGQTDRYEVWADEPPGGISGNWALEGYAICAPATSVPGYAIVAQGSGYSSVSPRSTAAGCPSGQRVIGSGASIAGGGLGRVGLQMSRASGPLDIARAAAAEDGAYSGNWQVTAYAICANPVGAAAEGSVQTGVSSASHVCPGTEQVHSVGGATGAGSTGQTFLNSLYLDPDLRAVRLSLTGVPSDGLAIQAICA